MKNMLVCIVLISINYLSFAQNVSTKIELCDLEPYEDMITKMEYSSAMKERFGDGAESWSNKDIQISKPSFHSFIEAVHSSYAYHRPLVISPDMIWILVLQGFSTHINQNPDSLRHYFVDFSGKEVLKVRRDDFTKGFQGNDWESVFPEFTKQIGNYTGDSLIHTTILDFSTTTEIEKAAFEITLMESMSNYFVMVLYTLCGIPEITLEGTTSDWELILESATKLKQYDLSWWIDDLIPILQEFVNASKGNANVEFWNQIYKDNREGSGSPQITGWIIEFFPYLKVKDKLVKNNELKYVTTGNFPTGISKADFYWNYQGIIFQMEFVAGFFGIYEDSESLSLKPDVGWCIIDTGEKGVKENDKEYEGEIMNYCK